MTIIEKIIKEKDTRMKFGMYSNEIRMNNATLDLAEKEEYILYGVPTKVSRHRILGMQVVVDENVPDNKVVLNFVDDGYEGNTA